MLGVKRKVERVRSLHMAILAILAINLAHFGNKGGESLRIKGRLVSGAAGLEAPLEANVKPGPRIVVGPASTGLTTPTLVVGDDGEFDLAAWVTEGGGYEGLVIIDGKLFGLAWNRLERDFEVAVVLEKRGRRLDEAERRSAQLFVMSGRLEQAMFEASAVLGICTHQEGVLPGLSSPDNPLCLRPTTVVDEGRCMGPVLRMIDDTVDNLEWKL